MVYSLLRKHMYLYKEHEVKKMAFKTEYYIVDREALPEVFVKVVEAKRLLLTGQVQTVQEATELLKISRSSFYKYKDMIEPFTDTTHKKTVTIACTLDDEPGVLSQLLAVIGEAKANILTIHQSIPINGVADISMSIEVLDEAWSITEIIDALRQLPGVHAIKILARE